MKTMQREATSSMLTRLGGDVTSTANRSLELLKQIESTIDALCYDQQVFGAFVAISHSTLDTMRGAKPVKPLDINGSIADSMLRAQVATKDLYELLCYKRRSAIADERLTEEDGVAEEYDRLIKVVSDLHDCMNDLRWAIGEHDADLCQIGGPDITTREDIEKYLA